MDVLLKSGLAILLGHQLRLPAILVSSIIAGGIVCRLWFYDKKPLQEKDEGAFFLALQLPLYFMLLWISFGVQQVWATPLHFPVHPVWLMHFLATYVLR